MKDPFDLIKGGSVLPAVMPGILGGAAITGKWANLANVGDCGILLILEAGLAGNGAVIALEQAKDKTGTGAKVLNISNLQYLVATDVQAPTSSEEWVDAGLSRTAPVATFDMDTVNGDDQEVMVFIRVHEGDMDSGFTHFRINCADPVGAARRGVVLYIAKDKLQKGEGDNLLAS